MANMDKIRMANLQKRIRRPCVRRTVAVGERKRNPCARWTKCPVETSFRCYHLHTSLKFMFMLTERGLWSWRLFFCQPTNVEGSEGGSCG